MNRREWALGLGLAAFVALAWDATGVRAEHARIDLRVFRLDPATGQNKDEATAFADQEPPAGGVQDRPLFTAKAGDPLAFQFYLTNTYPHGEIKGVTVTYFVVREEKPRQKAVPDPSKDAVIRGRFLMNFKPKCQVGSRVLFKIDDPGFYLLRVQTEGTQSDHEHFSAIDIEVK